MEQDEFILEKNVLANCLYNNEYIPLIKNILEKDSFFLEKHKVIWSIILEAYEKNEIIGPEYVVKIIRSRELHSIVESKYVILLNLPFNSDPIQDARIIQSEYISRKFVSLLQESTTRISKHKEDAYLTSCWMQEQLDNLFILQGSNTKIFKNTVQDALIDMRNRMNNETKHRLKTNTKFDELFDFSPFETIWFAGLSKMGKTKNIIYIIYHLIKNNPDIGIKWFTMEDDENKIIRHFEAIESLIPISKMEAKNENDKLNEFEYDKLVSIAKNIENYDISLDYGSHTMEYVTNQSMNFIRSRKQKHNIIIIDNFNILVDNLTERKGQIEKENDIAGKIQKLRIDTNKDGLSTTIVVLDHLNKEVLKDGLKRGFRGTEGQLKGSGRKAETMTQLIYLNKTSRFPELIDEYKNLPPVSLITGETTLDEILEKLTIYELILTRNGGCATGNPVRFMTNLDTMEFTEFEYMKKHSHNSQAVPVKQQKQIKYEDDMPF